MSRARRHKLRADLLTSRSRSVLAALSLAVGTMAVGAMQVASTTVDSSFATSFQAASPPSTMLRTDGFDAAILDEVRSHPDVSHAEGRRLLEVQVTGAGIQRQNVELVAMPDFSDNRTARIAPRGGSWPPADGQIVVEQASVGELGVAVGDLLAVSHRDHPPVDLAVVGTAFDVYEVSPVLGGSTRGYVAMTTLEQLTGSDDLDALYVRGSDRPLEADRAAELAATIRDDVLTPAGVSIGYAALHDPSEHLGEHTLAFIVTAMQLLSALAVVIAVALVLNTVTALLAQQRRHVGVMKAVGATSRQLTVQYLAYVLALAVVAFVVAVPASIALGRALAGALAGMANFELVPTGVPWAAIGSQALVALVLPVLAVMLVVRRAAHATVHEIVTDRGLAGRSRHDRTPVPMTRPTALAYRNAVRNRPRLALTILTIGLCGAVLVGVLSTQVALGRLSDEIAGYIDYDVEVQLNEVVATDRVRDVVGTVSGVAGIEGRYTSQAFRIRPDGSENGNLNLIGVPPGSSSIDPTLLEGRWFEADDDHAVVVNTHVLDEEPDLAVGDDVLLDVEGHRRAWRIVGVSTTTLLGPGVFVPQDDLATTIAREGQANLLAVATAPGADAAEVADQVDAALRAAGLDVGAVQTNAQLRSDFEGLVAIAVTLLLAVGAVLAVVAVVGVTGTMTLGVLDQTREIGVLRTLGASSRSVRRLLLLQGLAIAVAGGLVGIVLSVPVGRLLQAAIADNLIQAALPSGFSWFGVALWLPVALAIGALGATRPARVAAALTVRDTLAYE